MEEDIEGIIERIEKKLERKADYDTGVWLAQTDIENLIKGYRELKEMTESSIWQSNFDMKFYEENYIPKSKIKEKINAYSKSCAVVDVFIVDVLQELMEEK